MQFGGVTAVNLLNIEINEHEIVALIGPNGAGKNDGFQYDYRGLYSHQRRRDLYRRAG